MSALILNLIERCSLFTGKVASWITTFLVFLICTDVFMRYFLNESHVWVSELECHLFAAVFLLGSAYALNKDAHVRVDLFYANFSELKKAYVNLFGVILFLIPWCLIVIRASFKYARNSYMINETSPDPGGLPALWIVKCLIVLSFVLLLLEALSLSIKSAEVILGRRVAIFSDSSED
ncbi:MAG: TRAP transporter small permease subunit [Saprospiraceae bacterium]|nr:TRAP transporter small permease subunit [Saprospiraceae bacterium]